jgi:hypothetical protein
VSAAMTIEEAGEIILQELLRVLNADDVDAFPGPTGNEIDISTDTWTLHLEGWSDGIAWLALDSEPDDPAEFELVRRKALSQKVEGALVAANGRLDGQLARALLVSGDPFSEDLARALSSTIPPSLDAGE